METNALLRELAPMFGRIKAAMHKAAKADEQIIIDYIRFQQFQIDEAMFNGFREAKKEQKHAAAQR